MPQLDFEHEIELSVAATGLREPRIDFHQGSIGSKRV
jgi:hypothetical protein